MVRVRPTLVPAVVAPCTALAVALGPAVVAPAVHAGPALPVVQVEAIQLAGIGQDIYNAITPVVQYVVGGVSYIVNFVPVLGWITAAQININYFQGIQPSVAATVNYAAALLHDPLDFFPITRGYADTLLGVGHDLVSAQLRFLGFGELPPRPTAALMAPGPRAPAAGSGTPGTPGTPPAPAQSPAAGPLRPAAEPLNPAAEPPSRAAEPPSPRRGGATTRRTTPARDAALPAAAVVATAVEAPVGEPAPTAADDAGSEGNKQGKPGRRGHRQSRG